MLTGRADEIANGILLRGWQARVLAERQNALETAVWSRERQIVACRWVFGIEKSDLSLCQVMPGIESKTLRRLCYDYENKSIYLFSRNMEMKTIVVTLLGTILGLFSCNAQSASFRSVNAREFAEVISDSTVFVLDVRTAEEYAAGHIGNAVNIDVLQDDFKEKAVARIPEGKTVALYCRSGNRSKKAANMLSGKYKVVELATGWTGWNAEFGRNE